MSARFFEPMVDLQLKGPLIRSNLGNFSIGHNSPPVSGETFLSPDLERVHCTRSQKKSRRLSSTYFRNTCFSIRRWRELNQRPYAPKADVITFPPLWLCETYVFRHLTCFSLISNWYLTIFHALKLNGFYEVHFLNEREGGFKEGL